MYRIQTASGEEAAYLSLDEFATALQHGIVDDDALIHHARGNSWLPIETHPHYKLARAMATSLPIPEPEPHEDDDQLAGPHHTMPPRADPEPPATPTTQRRPPETATSATDRTPATRQADEQRTMAPVVESRREPEHWNQGYAIDTMEGLPLGPHRLVRKRSRRPLVMAIVVGTVATFGRWITLPKVQSTPVASAAVAGLEAPPPDLPMAEEGPHEVSPDRSAVVTDETVPSEAYRGAYFQAQAEMRESLSSLQFGSLFITRRLMSSDSLRRARRTVMAARNVVAVYRGLEVRIDRQFEAHARSLREPYETAMMADSLFDAIDGIYGLLLAQEGQYLIRGGAIRFNDRTAAANYRELASWVRRRSESYRTQPEGMPVTIAPLVLAASAPPPPPPRS